MEEKSVKPLSQNVFGDPLVECSCDPLTGWHRDGSCHRDAADHGQHTICCLVSESFLRYSKAQGNDLSSPMPSLRFPGLRPGDHWCVCALRWKQAYEDGIAPLVRLEATEISVLELIDLEVLKKFSDKGTN